MGAGYSAVELIKELLDIGHMTDDVVVRCYTQGHRVVLKIVAARKHGMGEPDGGKIVLTGNVIEEEP